MFAIRCYFSYRGKGFEAGRNRDLTFSRSILHRKHTSELQGNYAFVDIIIKYLIEKNPQKHVCHKTKYVMRTMGYQNLGNRKTDRN